MSQFSHFDSHEETYLSELMVDFPRENSLDIDIALRQLSLRYASLDIDRLRDEMATLTEIQFVEFFHRLPEVLHGYLYKDILGNAGIYRQSTDKNEGNVYFGLRQRFRGTMPNQISPTLKQATTLLSSTDPHPIYTIIKYYQQFVYIHPFYDANGRIGRFITTLYLDFHGYHISWEKLRQNNKWLKKLNECHIRINDEHTYETYIQRLVDHWVKFIFPKDEILAPDNQL